MGRVEWAALHGEEVETVLANLLYNAHNRALRIRPAQGDFGVDVVVPTSSRDVKWDVYQIKKFATNLESSQRKQIEKSFRRVLVGMVRAAIPLNNWYLVTPLDPTLGNLEWFKMMPENAIAALKAAKKEPIAEDEEGKIREWLNAPGTVIDWKGLPFCESLAADYPYVVDYYLHGGRERIRDAVKELAQLLQQDGRLRFQEPDVRPGEGEAALLTPAEVREHLSRLDRVLNTDPHYTYGHSVEPNRPVLTPEPGLVAATQESLAGGRWLTFKIFQRSAQSLDERPIPIELKFKVDTPEDHEALEMWRKFGKPIEANASFRADLPGGLGAESDDARVRLLPAGGDEKTYRLRLRIVTVENDVLAELGFMMVSTKGLDGTGSWTHGRDDFNTLETESCIQLGEVGGNPSGGGNMKFTLRALAGLEASKADPAVSFAVHLCSPNRLQVAGEYGPFYDFIPLDLAEPLVPPAVGRIVRSLAVIQARTSVPVLIPDLSSLGPEELRAIRRAAFLIEGNTTVGTWREATIETNTQVAMEVGGHYQFAIIEPLVVRLHDRDLVLGSIEHTLQSASIDSIEDRIAHAVPFLTDAVHDAFIDEVPDVPPGRRLVRGRPAPPVVR